MKPSLHIPHLQTPLLCALQITALICAAGFTAHTHAADASRQDGAFASVSHLKGEVTVTRNNGETRKLQKGDKVLVGEKISSSAQGEAVLQTRDAGIVAVRPNAEFIPERFAAEGKQSDHQVLRLISGSLRIISGWIGQINRSEHRVITPGATIGIRGTDHEPYVLPADQANKTSLQGTYDKVNRGATLLDANGGNVAIDSGKVGFARDPNAVEIRTRAMMTLLLPVLLDKVPDFYLPGSFDKELDRISANADANARTQFERQTGKRIASLTKDSSEMATPQSVEARPSPSSAPTPVKGCLPVAHAEAWLGQLDQAIIQRDIKTILGLFAPEIVATATVLSQGNPRTLTFTRNEMVQSILSSIANLKDYKQRRISIEAALDGGETSESCGRLIVKSVTVEQGLMNDKPFRIEATEDYLLERRDGEWLAVKSHTTQH